MANSLNNLLEKLEFDFCSMGQPNYGQKMVEQFRIYGFAPVRRELEKVWLEHPLGDEWREYHQASLQRYFARRAGWVYVAHSPQLPELVKIGRTSRSVEARMRSLTGPAILHAFESLYSRRCADSPYVEAAVHRILRGNEVQSAKELFKCSREEAVSVIDAVCQSEEALLPEIPDFT